MQHKQLTPVKIIFWIVIVAWVCLYSQQLIAKLRGNSQPKLIITEIMAANQTGLTDSDGDYSDWIELYNPGSRPLNLAGWALTDDAAQPQKWLFPNITLTANSHLVVFASGKNRTDNNELHTNFSLSRDNEFVGLYNVLEDRFIDTLPSSDNNYPLQFNNTAYGRYGDISGANNSNNLGYLNPTPGQANPQTSLWVDLVAPVKVSPQRGYYKAPFTVELTTDTPHTIIYYSTDGSDPSPKNSTPYTRPISITSTTLLRAIATKPNFRATPIATHSYIFYQDVINQPTTPAGFPSSWGGYQGQLVKADYEMDPEITKHLAYEEQLEAALSALPVISLVTDRQSFHHLYANPQRRGIAWERPISVEFFDPQQQQIDFQIDAGIRIQGESGREEYMPKHAFRLFFREIYGAGKLDYPLFLNSPVTQFDTLVLRSGVNRSYAGLPEYDQRYTTYTRDEWLRESQLVMSGSGVRGRFVHLYLNGLYWGLYNLVERPDNAFMATYFGGNEADWQTVSHEETVSNTSPQFKALHQLAAEQSLAEPEHYQTAQTYLDITHFIDYMILNWYVGNLDWAFNNWYAGVGELGEPLKYFVWDGERIWDDGAEIFFHRDDYLERPNLVKPLFEALMENPDFKMAVADHLYKHLFNDGMLTEENSRQRWLRLNKIVEPAIIAESARWGDIREEIPLTQEDWYFARDDVLQQMEGNVAKLIQLAYDDGYYPAIDPPVFSQQGGHIDSGFTLTMTTLEIAQATIYYTTDGSDPRAAITGKIAPTAMRYSQAISLNNTTSVKARLHQGQTWSALNQATFIGDNMPHHPLQITEIMYNPAGGADYEFIELRNNGDQPLNLAYFSFSGIEFTFSPTMLAPDEVLVLVRNPKAFAQRYPKITIGGRYKGQLSNKGETLSVADAMGQIITTVTYDDKNGWPLSPDGHGDSLVLVAPSQDPNTWQASLKLYGSPGVVE